MPHVTDLYCQISDCDNLIVYKDKRKNMSVYEKLAEIAKLEYDWNSYGSPPIHKDVIEWARSFYDKLTLSIDPYVLPTPRGGIQFEWHNEKYDLEIELCCDGSLGILWDIHDASKLSDADFILIRNIVEKGNN